MDSEEFFSDSLHLFGGSIMPDQDIIKYGDLTISIAPKEGKACCLLADQVFSPSLALAEMIERGKVTCTGKSWLELGAGTGLVSLVAASSRYSPDLLVLTDYPDQVILENLKANVESNRYLFTKGCKVRTEGYEWGKAVDHLNAIQDGFDILILSDLLHYDKSRDDLLRSINLLLARKRDARVYVGAGKYTPIQVCDAFLQGGEKLGLEWEEHSTEGRWEGRITHDGTYDEEALQARKNNSRIWIGQWKINSVN